VTVERELIAAEVAKRTTSRAHASGRELAVEKIEKFITEFERIAAHFRPVTAEDAAAGVPPNANGSWSNYAEWSTRALEAARTLAAYQTPKLAAVAITPAPPITEKLKRFTLTVFDGGKPVLPGFPPPDDGPAS
jgi:hypothetical protein